MMLALLVTVPALSGAPAVTAESSASARGEQSRTVRGRMQPRPGAPMGDVEVAVHQVPSDLPSVPAASADLRDSDLVLGVVVGGQPVAYPVRYLALFEVVNARVGDTPLAPTW